MNGEPKLHYSLDDIADAFETALHYNGVWITEDAAGEGPPVYLINDAEYRRLRTGAEPRTQVEANTTAICLIVSSAMADDQLVLRCPHCGSRDKIIRREVQEFYYRVVVDTRCPTPQLTAALETAPYVEFRAYICEVCGHGVELPSVPATSTGE